MKVTDAGKCWSDPNQRDFYLTYEGCEALYCPFNHTLVFDGQIIGYYDNINRSKKGFVRFLTSTPLERMRKNIDSQA